MSVGVAESTQEPIVVGRMSIRYLVEGTATGGMGAFELSAPPNSNVPPHHSDARNEECVCVLEEARRRDAAKQPC